MVRVALCDDHRVVRSGLRRLLDDEPSIEVVGEAGTAEEAVALARAECPDVLVMDLGLPGTDGIEATRRVLKVSPITRVLVLTVHDDVGYLRRASVLRPDGCGRRRAQHDRDVKEVAPMRTRRSLCGLAVVTLVVAAVAVLALPARADEPGRATRRACWSARRSP